MIIEDFKGYGYQDLTIVPATISTINSRSECNPFDEDGNLKIFASPMSTITNEQNIKIWKDNKITPIVPRNIPLDTRLKLMSAGEWVALSLKEFKDYFCKTDYNMHFEETYKVCVDLANGHMKSLYESINKAKELSRKNNYKLIIMTGNIANPDTYRWICAFAEVDYIRLSIGSGFNCLTSTQTSIHYPIATLINECYKFKKYIKEDIDNRYTDGHYFAEEFLPTETCVKHTVMKSCPKLVADGGIRGYADVVRAFALGADYVMIGSLFTGLLESAAPLDIECYNSHYKYSFNENGTVNTGVIDVFNIWNNSTKGLDEHWEVVKRNFLHDMKAVVKESYGMSTKKAQKMINPNAQTKTSEGCTKYIKVTETVKQWTNNMIDYLKSAMSYTDKRNMDEFTGKVKLICNSAAELMAINK